MGGGGGGRGSADVSKVASKGVSPIALVTFSLPSYPTSMRVFRIIIGTIVILGGGMGIVYGSRGAWRPWMEEIRRPSIPVGAPYRPAAPLVIAVTTTPVAKPVTTSTVLVRETATPPVPRLIDPFLFEGIRPAEANLAVPFMLQAPKQNWDMPYQEACEEASLLMTKAFLNGRTSDFTADEADRSILELVAYETQQGDPADITLRRIGEIAQVRYGFRPVVKTLTTMDLVRNAIANGYPVMIPASGKALKNPNFRNGGPPYHMLVARGYLRDGRIVTNDSGTRKGKEYVYDAQTLFHAVHDWNGGAVSEGEKIILVLMPK